MSTAQLQARDGFTLNLYNLNHTTEVKSTAQLQARDGFTLNLYN